MAFSSLEFRKTLGLFPTGVAIVTAIASTGERVGVTVSSFNSVSLSPPLVLFSIARTASSFTQIEAAPFYAINLLGENQSALSTRFAKTLSDKWETMTPLAGTTGCPLIPGVLAAFECEPFANYDGGDHLIFVGRVVNIHRPDTSGDRPLVFCRGAYHGLDATPDAQLKHEDSLWLHSW